MTTGAFSMEVLSDIQTKGRFPMLPSRNDDEVRGLKTSGSHVQILNPEGTPVTTFFSSLFWKHFDDLLIG
jgi:hypothetical protein